MQITNIIFQLVILLFSAIIHEVAHGYSALFQGDSTAKYENRLTLNPLRHIDPFGTVILPLLLFISGSPVLFGWAKPVPFNPYNLRNQKWGEALVAIAGPAINIVIAVVFGLVLRFGAVYLTASSTFILEVIVLINVMLAVFNLVPIPPLDGSKILFALLPERMIRVRQALEQYSLFLILLFIFVLWNYLFPVIIFVFSLITGLSLA